MQKNILQDGTIVFSLDSKIHNENGPAIIWPDGTKSWYKHDLRHNDNGPAVIRLNGQNEWWVDGVQCNEPQKPILTIVNND